MHKNLNMVADTYPHHKLPLFPVFPEMYT